MSDGGPDPADLDAEAADAYGLLPLSDALRCLSDAALFTDCGQGERASGALTEATLAAFGFGPGSDEAECLDRLIAIVREAA